MLKLKDLGITDKVYYIVGLGVIKSAKSARWMNKNLFGVDIPEKIISRIEQSNNESLEGIKICIELINKYMLIEGKWNSFNGIQTRKRDFFSDITF